MSFFHRCEGPRRREVLRVGALSAFGLSLPGVTALQHAASATTRSRPSTKSCILIWLDGGPSHLETFDLKPEAPREVRGPLSAVSSAVAGVQISECLPEIARRMNDVAIIRSVTSPLGEHNFGTHFLLSGFRPSAALEYPSFHAVGASLHDAHGVLPSNIAVPTYRVGGGKFTGAGFLPGNLQPFSIEADPSKPDFAVKDLNLFQGLNLDRLSRRRDFVSRLNDFSRHAETSAAPALDPQFEQAYKLTTSAEAQAAFNLDEETPATRSRYGRKTVGQCCLLARRLVERGVPFVTVNHKGWDTHNDLYTRLKEGYTGAKVPVGLIPSLDLAVSGLIDDLKDRNLLDETLIVVMGEFGRTPKLNTQGGRDHWPRVFSVALAGGGIRGGLVYGSSDAVGESPQDNPVTPSDLVATIYTLLGIDPELELQTSDGRPVRITPHESVILSDLIG